MNQLNRVFRTAENVVLTRIDADEVAEFTGNYITVVDGSVQAVIDGQQVDVPEILFNEVGVPYHFVDFREHGLKMAKKHGVYIAVKTEKIRVWRNVKPGEMLRTIIDGYEEHSVQLSEDSVAAQNVIKGEFYAIPKDVLEKKYEFSHSEFDYDVYVPKSNQPSKWVYSDVNVFGLLWGGIEFLTTPMINITDPNDCYGCNYIVWWGNDGKLASYKVLGYFTSDVKKYFPKSEGSPISVANAEFEPPKEL